MSGASSGEVTLLDAVRIALAEEMERDGRVVLMGEDIGVYGGAFKATAGLLERFGPGRVIDTPVVEEAIAGAAIGASLRGLRPVVEMQFFDFASRAFDMITNFAAKHRYRTGLGVPIVVRGPSGGGVHAGPFHSQSPEGYFARTPGLAVVVPSTAEDARGLLKAAIRDDDPVLFLEHKLLYRRAKGTLPEGDGIVPIGKAAVRREGRDLTIVTWGAMVPVALDGAAELTREGTEAEVIDLRTLLPMDEETVLESVRKTSKALVLHEESRTLGVGAEVAALLAEKAFEWLDAPVVRVTAPDAPVPFAPALEAAYLPGPATLLAAARKLAAY
ncbi:MAG TPA: alpha-ketoacid dehydrogenase subunit beta [Thermoanaerobaculia bacterium]|nr:alpha-ketoacid dehydrogenase subunit beta [Thermoanaerobaculia bacterium]